jgi:serine/threonine-protein kinase
MGKQLRETPEAPSARAPSRGIPPELDAVVMKALEKEPEKRFVSAGAMREALAEALAAPAARRVRGRRIAGGALAGLVFAGFAIGAVAMRGPRVALAPEVVAVGAEVPRMSEGSPDREADPLPEMTSVTTITAALETTTPVPTATLTAAATPAATAPPHDRLVEARRYAKGHMADARALKGWATAAYRAGDLHEARRAGEAWELHDGTAEPRIFLATVLDAGGRHAEAKAMLDEWLEIHPDSAEARITLARLGAPASTERRGGSIARR